MRGRLCFASMAIGESCREADGRWTTLADRYEAKRFNSPNDLASVERRSVLHRSDYGLPKGSTTGRELDFCGSFASHADGKYALSREMTMPNGLSFSPDERSPCGESDPKKTIWMAFPVNEDGTLGRSRVFCDPRGWPKSLWRPAGCLKVDRSGNLLPRARRGERLCPGWDIARADQPGPDGRQLRVRRRRDDALPDGPSLALPDSDPHEGPWLLTRSTADQKPYLTRNSQRTASPGSMSR